MSDPVQQFVEATRAMLVAGGLERHEDAGRVWFSNRNTAPAGARTFVLLHGVNDQAGTWAAVAPKLAQQFHFVIPDLAGHGESAPAEGPIDMQRIVDGVAATIDAESSGPVTLAGNSMGGWVSMLYTLAHPERVERLVLEDASGMSWPISVPLVATNREQAKEMMRAVNGPADATPDVVIEAFLARASGSPMLRVIAAGVVPYLMDARFGELRVPVKLVWGRDDGVLPLAYANALQQKIAGATLEVIDGAAHIPHRQQPERFLACLTAI